MLTPHKFRYTELCSCSLRTTSNNFLRRRKNMQKAHVIRQKKMTGTNDVRGRLPVGKQALKSGILFWIPE